MVTPSTYIPRVQTTRELVREGAPQEQRSRQGHKHTQSTWDGKAGATARMNAQTGEGHMGVQAGESRFVGASASASASARPLSKDATP